MKQENPILRFIHQVRQLKFNPRFVDNPFVPEKDTVGSHSWRTSLMALSIGAETGLYAGEVGNQINMLRVMQLISVHDLVELKNKGTKSLGFRSEQDKKEADETTDILSEFSYLPAPVFDLFKGLWEEYLAQETIESRMVKAMEHIESNSTWLENGAAYQDPNAEHIQGAKNYVAKYLGIAPELDMIIRSQIKEIKKESEKRIC